jgi:phage tail-like protein
MAIPDFDGAVGHSFGLEFDGITIKQITEVSGLKMEQDVVEYKSNSSDGKYHFKKLPGRPKPGEVTLTRALTADNSFDKWQKSSHFGKMGEARKGGAIVVYDYEGTPVKRYKLTNAWAKSVEIGGLKAGDTSVLTEKITLVHEGMEAE